MLRVLFAKMNEQQKSVNTALAQATSSQRSGGGGGSSGKNMTSTGSKPVFISEGAYTPLGDDVESAALYQTNFEIFGREEEGGEES